jgi:hypothetical protein
VSISSPISISLNGTAYSLPRINQDSFGSEYLYRGATFELRVKIRHSKEKVNADGIVIDRHNVELTQTVYPAAGVPAIIRQGYAVLRNGSADDATNSSYLYQGLVDFLTDSNLGDLINWVN